MLLKILLLQSMPKMPESEKKEESAESREEAKEQVRLMWSLHVFFFVGLASVFWLSVGSSLIINYKPDYSSSFYIIQERLKAAEAKRIEKERTEKYQKLKGDAKDTRSKYREKVRGIWWGLDTLGCLVQT